MAAVAVPLFTALAMPAVRRHGRRLAAAALAARHCTRVVAAKAAPSPPPRPPATATRQQGTAAAASAAAAVGGSGRVTVLGQEYVADELTNISPAIVDRLRRRGLHNQPHHPLGLLKRRATMHFNAAHANAVGNPSFAIFDGLSPVVRLEQNFDSLLVPADHASRSPKDSYYVNREWMLRAHMTAHDADLIRSGLDRFLTFGDVYRRDEIDRTHYPVFHQMDGARLFTSHELFKSVQGDASGLSLFEHTRSPSSSGSSTLRRTAEKQAVHSYDAVHLVEHDLKRTLSGLVRAVLGKDVESRWVSTYFPFTHPSWELEIKTGADEWMELLGCGILEHDILQRCGAGNKVGWAFGLGLERLAMLLFSIPDVRLFWSEDSGFLSQFKVDDPFTPITYKEISKFPQLYQDISFWIPTGYSTNDFYDVARSVGGDLVERVELVDSFTHPKTQRISHCYRVTYRHMERSLTTDEVNVIQEQLRSTCVDQLGVEVRAK